MKMNNGYRLLAVLSWLAGCGIGHADTATLALHDAMALFYRRNLDLLAAQYNIDQARADQIIAAAIPNPTLNIETLGITENANMGAGVAGCNPDPRVSCGFGQNYSFSQLIEIAGKRELRMESSAFATQTAESEFLNALRIFSNTVRDAYYDLLHMQKNARLAGEIARHFDETAKINQLRLKSGEISESDFLRVRMEAIRAEADEDDAQKAVRQAQAHLALLLHGPAQSLPLEVREQWPTFQDIGQHADQEALIGKALAQRPDLQADRQRVEQAQKQLELARRLIYPDVTFNAGYAHDPSNNNLDTFFVGVNVPVPLFYQYQGETDKSAVNLNQARLAVEQTELAIRHEVIDALANWNSANNRVQRFETGLLDDAKTVRDSSDSAFRNGATSVIEFIEAQRNYKIVMHDYYQATINRTKAYFNLAKALGEELADDKKIASPANE